MRRIPSFNNDHRTTTTQNNKNYNNNRIMLTTIIQVAVILAATIIFSAPVTNAFVPIKTQTTTHTQTQTQTIRGDIFNTRRGAVYSNNNVNGNNNNSNNNVDDRLSVPVTPLDDEPIDSTVATSSSTSTSGQQIEFLFND